MTPVKHRIALLLRGHVRDAFQNDAMRLFVRSMQNDVRVDVDVYVQTWEHDEAPANCSWRTLNSTRTPITAEMVDAYLQCKTQLNILPEDAIGLVGSVEGMIGGTSQVR